MTTIETTATYAARQIAGDAPRYTADCQPRRSRMTGRQKRILREWACDKGHHSTPEIKSLLRYLLGVA